MSAAPSAAPTTTEQIDDPEMGATWFYSFVGIIFFVAFCLAVSVLFFGVQRDFTEEPGTEGGTQAPQPQPAFGSVKKPEYTPAQRKMG